MYEYVFLNCTKGQKKRQANFTFFVHAPRMDLSRHALPPTDFNSQNSVVLALVKLATIVVSVRQNSMEVFSHAKSVGAVEQQKNECSSRFETC